MVARLESRNQPERDAQISHFEDATALINAEADYYEAKARLKKARRDNSIIPELTIAINIPKRRQGRKLSTKTRIKLL